MTTTENKDYEYIFQIPSYNRIGKQSTVKMLHEWGIPKDAIWIGVHDEQAKSDYEEDIGEFATIINCNINNVGGKRNHLLSMAKNGQKVVIFDDDVQRIQWLDRKGEIHDIESGEQFQRLLDYCFSFASKCSSVLWGTYPVVNPYFMSYTIDVNNILICTFMGIVAGTFNFKEDTIIKEDMELCLRNMASGMNVVRFNFIVADAKHRTQGGAYDEWKSGIDDSISKDLCRKYPSLVSYSKSNASKLRFLKALRYKGKIDWEG